MGLSRAWLAVALIASCLLGCSKPEDKYVGHYVGHIAVTQKALDEAKKKGFEKQLQQEIASTTIDLTLNLNKTFLLSNSDVKSEKSGEGTWALSGNKILLTPKAQKGPATPPGVLKLNVSQDGKTLTADQSDDPAAASLASLTFKKS